MIYLDSSALVKRYIEETGSEKVRILMEKTSIIAVSRLAYAETLSAIHRRRKSFAASDEEFAALIREFRNDWEHFHVLEMNSEALQSLDEVIEKYALRGADSIHLSTALWFKHVVKTAITFVASDNELLQAAKNARLKTLNPNDYPDGNTLRI